MPHLRKRHVLGALKKLSRFWPVVGVLGLRQAGKSTLFRELLDIPSRVTLDDEDTLADMNHSAKNFLARHPSPLLIDEAQKSPKLFEAIKLRVDRQKQPGSYFLTGSSQFSSKLGIRESLTGRIGLIRLHPFLLSEAHREIFDPSLAAPLHGKNPRFSIEQSFEHASKGGLPVPLFMRDPEQRESYYRLWLETSILRDCARIYGKRYDPDVAWSILARIGTKLREGELPDLTVFRQDSRKARGYLDALENTFILRKIPCHDAGVGRDVWLPTDTGIAQQLMEWKSGEGATLSLARIFVLNEILATTEYTGKPLRPLYFKTARSAPVDLVWNGIPIKISDRSRTSLAYDERPLAAAMKALHSKKGILCVSHEMREELPNGIHIVPLSYWS
jgi:predicted AAA+ superfamily ATPase